MTISNTIRTAGPYIGNGVTTAFPFYFKIFKTADLLAVQTDVATGVATSLVLNSGYTVTLNPDQNANPGGTTTLPAALATGKTLVLTSSLDYLQPLDITNGGGFYPAVLNAALDRLTIFCQQLFSLASRSLKLPLSDTGMNTELPSAAARSNKLLGFDSVGRAVVVAPASGSSAELALTLYGPGGGDIVGYSSPSASTPSVRSVKNKLGERVSLLDYIGADPTGANDNGALIQKAVTEAADYGVYVVDVPGVFRSDQGIILPGGVTLDGGITPGYYAGMPYFAIPSNAKTGPKGRIIAGAVIANGLIQFDETLNSSFGFGLKNIIIDANKLAANGIAHNPASLTERVTRLEDVLIQGSTGDGINMSNVLVQLWRNIVVASCHGFGVKFSFGVSDSQFEGLYIHTCDGGAMQIGDGSTNLHFRGGKWEDNYANGLEVFASSPGSAPLIYLNDVSINTNNGNGVVNNGGSIFMTASTIYGHNLSPSSASIDSSSGFIQMNGASIFGNSINLRASGGIIDVRDSSIANASVSNVVQTGGQISVLGDTRSGVPSLRNPGARRIAVAIATGGTGVVTFTNALDGPLGPAYFDMKAFDLTITHAQFPSAPNPLHSFNGQVVVGKTDTAIGAAVKTISASAAGFITTVTATVSGLDLIISITVGGTYGTGGGSTVSYVSLMDIGHNIYN